MLFEGEKNSQLSMNFFNLVYVYQFGEGVMNLSLFQKKNLKHQYLFNGVRLLSLKGLIVREKKEKTKRYSVYCLERRIQESQESIVAEWLLFSHYNNLCCWFVELVIWVFKFLLLSLDWKDLFWISLSSPLFRTLRFWFIDLRSFEKLLCSNL